MADINIYIFFLKKFSKNEKKATYHSNFNFECNTESGSKESLSVALGLTYYAVLSCFFCDVVSIYYILK
jgi:hypothetical protein